MNTKHLTLYFLLALITLLLAGCGIMAAPPEPINMEALYTAAAQTVVAQATRSAQQTAAAPLTQVVTLPTATAVPPTATLAAPTNTPPSQPTARPATATPVPPTPMPCNWAQFVKDVSIPDGSLFTPGAGFTKIWRIRNIGSCTWNSSYDLVFVNGTAMTSDKIQALPGNVRPGETIDLAIDLSAPGKDGSYRGYWMLSNPDGYYFGIGKQAEDAFWVDIQVAAQPNSDYAYDFAANYCSANWSSAMGDLSCSERSDSIDGAVTLLQNPALESRVENELGLWFHPNNDRGGWITGEYPAYKVKNGDHIRAEIGCLAGSKSCDVIFILGYRVGNSALHTLGTWNEVYDGNTNVVDVDLTGLAGESVKFYLTVENNGKAGSSGAVWFVPHIEANDTLQGQVLTWQQDNPYQLKCDELRISLTNSQAGEARALSCLSNPSQELKAISLTTEQLNYVKAWVIRLTTFTNVQTGTGNDQTTNVKLSFKGQGDAEPSTADLKAMQSLADSLFSAMK